MVQPLAEADRRQQLASPRLAAGLATQLGRQHDVFQRAQGGQQQEGLEHKAHLLGPQPGTPLLVQLQQRLAEDLDIPLARQIQPGQQSQQGGLAGAGSADQRHRFAAIDLQVDPFKDGEAFLAQAHCLAQALDVDNGS